MNLIPMPVQIQVLGFPAELEIRRVIPNHFLRLSPVIPNEKAHEKLNHAKIKPIAFHQNQ